MSAVKKVIVSALLSGCALCLTACGSSDQVTKGRLYYTVSEVGCTRIEWTDIDGHKRHPVLGVAPERDELGKREDNKDNNELLARNSKYVSAPCVSRDGKHMLCLYGKKPAICLYNLETGEQEVTVKVDGDLLRPDFVGDSLDFVYTRRIDDKQFALCLYQGGKSQEIYRGRILSAPAWCNMEKKVYFTESLPDGYVVLKKCDLQGQKVEQVMEYVSSPAFKELGGKYVAIFDGKMHIFDVRTLEPQLVSYESGVKSVCWNPDDNALAYVRNNKIYRLQEGQSSDQVVQVDLPHVKVIDVCWAKWLN